jgi:hypothetical protein
LHRVNNHISGESGCLSHLLFGFSSRRVLSILMLCALFWSCSDREPVRSDKAISRGSASRPDPYIVDRPHFDFSTKYPMIRSYPEGGGVFIVRAVHDDASVSNIALSVKSDSGLNALIDLNEINGLSGIAEITIRPDQSIDIGSHQISIWATDSNMARSVDLKIEVIDWPAGNPETAESKQEEFVEWLEVEHPELGQFSGRDWFPYLTYPGIWVVEHWTFLDHDWEMRICFHVMIPPYDWSMLLLRPRGHWDPILAARRDSDGTTYEIPIDEYPTFFSY